MVEKGEEISDLSPLLQIKTAIQKLKVVYTKIFVCIILL